MEKEYRISWLKVIGVLILIVILIAILCYIYPKKDSKKFTSSTYINNINMMKQAGFEYFRGNSLPDKIGESNKITLDEMITSNLIVEFLDENGNTCNKEDSYIQATKTLDDEYTMKVFLSCDNKSDYIITTISAQECTDCNNDVIIENEEEYQESNSSNNASDKTTNSSNNTGSSNNSTSSSSSYKPTTNKVTYVTNYNINYVNNCKNCTESNCNNNCVSNVYHTVIFNSNNGSSVDNQIVKHGETATYEVSYREGYKFLGWYLDGEKYDFSTPVTKKITLIAKWKKVEIEKNIYIVKFESNGGNDIEDQIIDEGYLVIKPKNPTRECYEFAGWYMDKALTKKYDFATSVTKDMTLYAKWIDDGSCKNEYTVKFESNGGTIVDSQTVLEGETAYKPKDPTRECYEFIGWYMDKALTKKYDFATSVIKDMTLYAKWIDDGSCKEVHTVIFDSNGGTKVNNQIVLDGTKAFEPNIPTRNGYTFLGWYLNGKLFDFNTRIYEDILLEAMWKKDAELYYTYCKVEDKTYYSTTYVNANQSTWNYDWTIKFDDLINVEDLKIISHDYLTTTSHYNKAYLDYLYGKGITMVDGNVNYEVPITSGTELKTYSLKYSNFNKYMSSTYYDAGYWYVDAFVTIKNYNNVNKYYAANINKYIHFVPFYFEISYTDMNNCINDKASNASLYYDYVVKNSFYR